MSNKDLAAAIRRSLGHIYALSDDELAARDAKIKALFHAVERGSSMNHKAKPAFDQLAETILGSPLGK